MYCKHKCVANEKSTSYMYITLKDQATAPSPPSFRSFSIYLNALWKGSFYCDFFFFRLILRAHSPAQCNSIPFHSILGECVCVKFILFIECRRLLENRLLSSEWWIKRISTTLKSIECLCMCVFVYATILVMVTNKTDGKMRMGNGVKRFKRENWNRSERRTRHVQEMKAPTSSER